MRLVNISIYDAFTLVIDAEDRFDAECKAREFGDILAKALKEAGWGSCLTALHIDIPDFIHTSREGLDFETACYDQGPIALPAEKVGYTIVKADLERITNEDDPHQEGAMLLDTGQVFPSREEAERKAKDYNNQGSSYLYWAVPVAIKV